MNVGRYMEKDGEGGYLSDVAGQTVYLEDGTWKDGTPRQRAGYFGFNSECGPWFNLEPVVLHDGPREARQERPVLRFGEPFTLEQSTPDVGRVLGTFTLRRGRFGREYVLEDAAGKAWPDNSAFEAGKRQTEDGTWVAVE